MTQSSPCSGTALFRYDLAGRLVSSQDVRFGRRRFRYDVAGQLTEAVNGVGGAPRSRTTSAVA